MALITLTVAPEWLLSVTCYLWFAICHLLFVTCYLLLAICYLLSVNCYLLVAICYMVYIWNLLLLAQTCFLSLVIVRLIIFWWLHTLTATDVQTRNGTWYIDIYNMCGIAHPHTNRKYNKFMQRWQGQIFTYIFEWGQRTCILAKHTRRWTYSALQSF